VAGAPLCCVLDSQYDYPPWELVPLAAHPMTATRCGSRQHDEQSTMCSLTLRSWVATLGEGRMVIGVEVVTMCVLSSRTEASYG
jgi:hypothetical protein